MNALYILLGIAAWVGLVLFICSFIHHGDPKERRTQGNSND